MYCCGDSFIYDGSLFLLVLSWIEGVYRCGPSLKLLPALQKFATVCLIFFLRYCFIVCDSGLDFFALSVCQYKFRIIYFFGFPFLVLWK